MNLQKYKPYRNKKILALANGQAYQICGNNDGSVVACHSDKIIHGKGVGKKADDHFVAYLCFACHGDYDSHKLTQYDFDLAVFKTQKIWLEKLLPME